MEGWEQRTRGHQYLIDNKGERAVGQRSKRRGQARVGGDTGGNDTVEAKGHSSFRKMKMVKGQLSTRVGSCKQVLEGEKRYF